mmetsp:Transcript_861/g.2138  ORF Transcript_861/g.2138 Transcript_861/m.2138 type:complete len:209 (+) Transcript_861:75-701(+)
MTVETCQRLSFKAFICIIMLQSSILGGPVMNRNESSFRIRVQNAVNSLKRLSFLHAYRKNTLTSNSTISNIRSHTIKSTDHPMMVCATPYQPQAQPFSSTLNPYSCQQKFPNFTWAGGSALGTTCLTTRNAITWDHCVLPFYYSGKEYSQCQPATPNTATGLTLGGTTGTPWCFDPTAARTSSQCADSGFNASAAACIAEKSLPKLPC